MKKLLRRLKCLFGFHGKPKLDIVIVDVRYVSHAIDYDFRTICEYCKKPLDNDYE